MNFKYAFIGAAALLVLPSAANALTVGSSDSGNCYPFACNDSGSNVGQSFHYQQIYNASLFGTSAVQFNMITFNTYTPVPAVSVLNGSYVISFSTTSAALGSGYPVTPLANTASFFSGNLGGPIGATFSITGTNYVYNPLSGNLVLDVVVTNQDNVPNGSGNGYFYADYTGSATSRAYDNGSGTNSGDGALVTTFNTSAAVPEPASWALMVAGFGMVGFALRRRSLATA